MKNLVIFFAVVLTYATQPTLASELIDDSNVCVKGICVNDLVAIEGQGLFQAVGIEDEEYMVFHGNKHEAGYAIHFNQLDVNDPVRGGGIVKIKNCEESSRFYTCTAINNYKAIGMKYSFDRNIVEQYLNN